MDIQQELLLPHPTPIAVVNAFNAAWAEGDIDKAISFVAEDSVYALHISGEALPHGGETVGRDNMGSSCAPTNITTAPRWRPSCACSGDGRANNKARRCTLAQQLGPRLTGRAPEMRLVASREVRQVREPARIRDVADGAGELRCILER